MPTSVLIAILALAAVPALAWLWRWLAGPSPIALTSPAKRREVFNTTLTNGAPGARVRLQVLKDPSIRIDYRKYITDLNRIGLSAVLERTQQTAKHFTDIREALQRRGISCVVTADAHGQEQLEMDVKGDTTEAEAVAKCVFEDALGLDLARDVVGYYDLVLLVNTPRITGVGGA